MHYSETNKAFPRQGHTAVVTCPHCGISRSVPVNRLRARNAPLKVQCSCGPVFGILVELRKTWRKTVDLQATYTHIGSKKKGGAIVVRNISKQGLGFAPPPDHDLKTGDTLRISFTLDDKDQTVIEKESVVKFVNSNMVGCEFSDENNEDERLTRYLNHT